MKELGARAVLLVKAVEEADEAREVLSEEDRKYASRTARELAQWDASERKAAATFPNFLELRADQLLKRLSARYPTFSSFVRRQNAVWMFGWLMPLAAFLIGVAADRIDDPERVDLLSLPLLLIIGWNVLVYLTILAWAVMPKKGPGPLRKAWVRRVSVGTGARPRRLHYVVSTAMLEFLHQWTRLSLKLNGARLARALHLSAAALALGAIISLYSRGVLTRYSAGWESTFLDSEQVYTALYYFFYPVIAVFHMQGFSLEEVATLRFGHDSSALTLNDNGARWVHLYAGALMLYVVVPRLLLALPAAWRAWRLRHRFPLDLDQPYFRKLAQAAGSEAGVLRVVPYSFSVDETRSKGLEGVAVEQLGDRARLRLLPSIDYGTDPAPAMHEPGAGEASTVTALLFSMAATPEKENHGAAVAALVAASGEGATVLLDQSALVRLDPERRKERVELWREFCIFHGAQPFVVDLLAPRDHIRESA
ncbi:MAG TPA: DUF2868 domain-containing protein [Pseudoduganella sp.]